MKKYILLTVLTFMSVGAIAGENEIGDSSFGSAVRTVLGIRTAGEIASEYMLNNPLRRGADLVALLLPNINDPVPNTNDVQLVMRGKE